ncbi:MAG: hypothetical protein IT514_02795 [Burkholderiales bacterium]|nr:hypothetical protein [Burkholderiales bacterium]
MKGALSVNTLVSLLFFVPLLIASAPATTAELGTRSSAQAGVTVKVTPRNIAAEAAVWEFTVVLETHSQELSDDLAKTASLVDSRGVRHAPLAWDGAPAGGHHRSGVLRFKGLGERGDALELQIRRAGEPAPRVFRWKLK